MKALLRLLQKRTSENKGILLTLVMALIALAALTAFVIYPAYQGTHHKMYSSSLGQPQLLRRAGEPIQVKIGEVSEQSLKRKIMGEGVCASQPVLVPLIPMALIQEVYVEEGQRVQKGDLLAVLDSSQARLKYESAKLALSTAESELERVKLGSAYVLAQERPEVEKINLRSLQGQIDLAQTKLNKYEEAYRKGVIAEVRLLEVKNEFTIAKERLSRAELAMTMAENGVKESLKIAQNATTDARQALKHREHELTTFTVHAPASGVIDRVLINPGEYNQDSGKPGFLISSGLWFDAYFDQAEFAHIKEGQQATLSFESYPGREFQARVTNVKPVVSFNSGGPEISRPLRPRGTGSPEWAATFKVKLEIQQAHELVTGMTGFARIEQHKTSLTAPRAAVTSISAGKGIVYVVDHEASSNKWREREIRVGHIDLEQVEIREGLALGEKVIIEGHWNLLSDDQIRIQN